jgi:uncharacterized 2Fe-2S/4Fe-4S cluster protein (DUF4445 family)
MDTEIQAQCGATTLDPLVHRLTLTVPPPSLADTVSDRERLEGALYAHLPDARPRFTLTALQAAGPALRRGDWRATLTLADVEGQWWVTAIEPGESNRRCLGLAVDVGTTTVSMEVVDVVTGEVLGSRSAPNRQRQFGTDVTSRLIHAERPGGLDELHQAVLATLDGLAEELVSEAGVQRREIQAVVCAGNTIMAHTLLQLDPTAIRREPYVPVTRVFPTVRARDVGLMLADEAILYSVPAVSGYVGGDITAGLLATGITEGEPLSLLIDIGTNGETVLGNRDWLVACSGSAGSAFEGCGLEWGMSAAPGAIERLWVEDRQIRYATVGGEAPRGICGSGLIEGMGRFLAAGIIDRAGKLNAQGPGVRRGEYHTEIVLAPATETAMGQDITLRQPDLENLIRDKAALYAGSRILLGSVGLGFEDVAQILIAGNFGHSLDVEQAVHIGLLPDVPRQKIRFIGNSSLAGARRTLLSRSCRQRALEVAASVTALELTAEPRYFDEYTAALFLPHTDLSLFPSLQAPAYQGQ